MLSAASHVILRCHFTRLISRTKVLRDEFLAKNGRRQRFSTQRLWYEVEDTDLEECDAATSHLSPQSWRFYIPAYMRMTLKVLDKSIWETDVPHWTLFSLTLRDDYPGIDEHSLQRYRLLTPEQCRAVRDFLVYVRDYAYENPSYSRDAQEALEAYWESVANEFNSPLHADVQARQ